MRISVVGIGYVGLSTAALWAACHDVEAIDVVPDKVQAVKQGRCPFADAELQNRLTTLKTQGKPLRAALNRPGALADCDMVFIATPTDYDEALQRFDVSTIEDVMRRVACDCPSATVIVRSTMQPGATDALAAQFRTERMLYCPEFLREGTSFHDCLHPSRLVVGSNDKDAFEWYGALLKETYRANGQPVPSIVECSVKEAEAAKLFSNTYLAMRVAFFNELDSYALGEDLDTRRIIQAVSADTRIGDQYNNPSFGYGGYCLPKDSKALLCSMRDAPHDLIEGVIRSNASRKQFLVDEVLKLTPTCVGIHRLTAKYESDNLRSSAVADIVEALVERDADVLVYEPMLNSRSYHGARVTDSLSNLLKSCDVILANRYSDDLEGFDGAVFTRDLFTRD